MTLPFINELNVFVWILKAALLCFLVYVFIHREKIKHWKLIMLSLLLLGVSLCLIGVYRSGYLHHLLNNSRYLTLSPFKAGLNGLIGFLIILVTILSLLTQNQKMNQNLFLFNAGLLLVKMLSVFIP